LSILHDAVGGVAEKTNEVFGADGQTGTGNLLAALPCTWFITLIAMAANGLQSPSHTF
jgi:hypothetical protein